jgi:hypothetical protein
VRPTVEPLEDRAVPALGIFLENFSADVGPSAPGWDSWDNDPATFPPDELHFRNNFPGAPLVTDGPTASGGYLAIETRNTPFDPAPFGDHVLTLLSAEGLPGVGSITFSFPAPGVPGGPLLGEEIAIVGIDVRGLGTIIVQGANAQLTQSVISQRDVQGLFIWEHVAVTRNSLNSAGVEIGAIQSVRFIAGPDLEVNRLSALVLDAETPPPTALIANDDHAVVSQRQPLPEVTFNWRQNDVQENAETITLHSYTQPQHGQITMDGPGGTGTYRPDPGFLGRDSFSYTISDPHSNTDAANVILDVTNNVAPTVTDQVLHFEHGAPGPVTGTLPYADADGDPAVVLTLLTVPAYGDLLINGQRLDQPLSGEPIRLPIANGHATFEYRPTLGKLIGSDFFSYAFDDGLEDGESRAAVLRFEVPNFAPEVVIPPGDLFLDYVGGSTRLTPTVEEPASDLLYHQTGLDLGFNRAVRSSVTIALDSDGDPLHPVLVDPPQHGTVVITSATSPSPGDFLSYNFVYTPNPGMNVAEEDIFTYRLSDGAAQTEDLIFVRIQRTPGAGIAFSDTFFYENDSGGVLDPFLGGIQDGNFVDLDTLPQVSRETLGLFEFTPADLLQNDSFQHGFSALAARQAIPGADIRIQIARVPGEGATLRDNFNRALDDVLSPFHIFGFHESIYFFPHDIQDGPQTYAFDYRFIFQHAGHEPISSETITALIVAHVEPHSDADGIPDDAEHIPARESNSVADGNSDGIQDSNQAYVASLPIDADVPYPYVTLATDPRFAFVGVQAISAAQILTPPADPIDMPLGSFRFRLTGLQSGQPATVTLIPPPGIRFDTYYKLIEVYQTVGSGRELVGYQPVEFLYDEESELGAVFFNDDDQDPDTDRIVLHLRDGGSLADQDVSSGIILDPGAPAILLPTAAADAYRAIKSRALAVAAPGVLTNDTHPAAAPLTAELVQPPAHGTLTLRPDGSFTYTPRRKFVGTDTFTYRASTGSVASAEKVVTLTVIPPRRAPLDIRPGSPHNLINLHSQGLVTVALFSTPVAIGGDTFDAWRVLPASIRFGDPRLPGRVPPLAHKLIDLNRDGRLDLVLHFSIPALRRAAALAPNSKEAIITGLFRTRGGAVPFEGNDAVHILSHHSSPGKTPAFDEVFRHWAKK